jgi:hypothetical protein
MPLKRKKKGVALPLALAAVLVGLLVVAGVAVANHTHPANGGAKTLRFTVVPAFKACTSPNSTHGTPLGGPSCTPPVQVSTNLTTGEVATNQFKGTSSFLIQVFCTNGGTPPTCGAAGDQEDVKLVASATDVRCKSGIADATKCSNENGTPTGKVDDDYIGQVQGTAQIRITDSFNGSPGFTTHATVVDLPFPVTGTCAATADATLGSNCSVNTTADAVVPNVVKEGKKANVEIGQIQVNDGGADGIVATSGNLLFAVQGIYIP